MQNPGGRSPWWYRQRGLVIGAIYAAGFAVGYSIWSGAGDEPSCVVLGSLLGSHGVAIVLWAGVVAALIAFLLRLSGTAYLREATVFAGDVQRDRLVVAGPFRYLRNPLYLGNIFLALAIATLATPLGAAIIVVGNALFVVLLANEEAGRLAERYGATYDAFRAAVPAFVPRLGPASVPGSVDAAPSYRAAFFPEMFSLVFAVALVPVAAFGEAGLPVFYWLWFGFLPVFLLVRWWAARRSTSGTAR